MCGLKPWEFLRCTAEEFRALVDGANDRLRRAEEARAWVVVHLMNATGNFYKDPMTIRKLIGREPGEAPTPAAKAAVDPEAQLEMVKVWNQALGGTDGSR